MYDSTGIITVSRQAGLTVLVCFPDYHPFDNYLHEKKPLSIVFNPEISPSSQTSFKEKHRMAHCLLPFQLAFCG